MGAVRDRKGIPRRGQTLSDGRRTSEVRFVKRLVGDSSTIVERLVGLAEARRQRRRQSPLNKTGS